MASAPFSPSPTNTILSFDGGGVRGLSVVLILKSLMDRIRDLEAERSKTVAARTGLRPLRKNPEVEVLPRDYFELVCGTSTGGLIAIMLARLNMTAAECIAAYVKLSSSVFGKRNWFFSRYLYDARRLREAINSVVRERLGTPAPPLTEHIMHRPNTQEGTNVFVVTLAAENLDGRPQLLRSYSSRPDDAAGICICSIADAAWATAAAPTFFKSPRLQIETDAPFVEYVDGGLGYNNPAQLAWNELKRHKAMSGGWQPLIVSIGTGLSNTQSIGTRRWTLPILYKIGVGRALAELTTTTAQVDVNLSSHLAKGRYFRFNVDHGLANIRLDRHEKLDDIYDVTRQYLMREDVVPSLDQCAQAVFEERWRGRPLEFGAFLVPHSIPKSHAHTGGDMNMNLTRPAWYLTTVTASNPYPPDVEHSKSGPDPPSGVKRSEVRPIGNHVVCSRNPLNVSLRLFDPNVPAGKYSVVWILCFFGELPTSGSRPHYDLDGAGLHAHPDLFVIAGSPREDINFRHCPVKMGHANPMTDADLLLFRSGSVKHGFFEDDWSRARGRGWVEIKASRRLIVMVPGAVGFYISQPAQNYIAGWCFGGVRLEPEDPTADGRGRPGPLHQATLPFASASTATLGAEGPVPPRLNLSRPSSYTGGPTWLSNPTDPESARADTSAFPVIPAHQFTRQFDSPATTSTVSSSSRQLRATRRRSTSPLVQFPMHGAGRSGERE